MPKLRDITEGPGPRDSKPRGPGRPRKNVVIVESVNRLGVEDELLTTAEVAALTKMSKAWYEKQRWLKVGPPFHKRGRAVRYLKSELVAWWGLNSPAP